MARKGEPTKEPTKELRDYLRLVAEPLVDGPGLAVRHMADCPMKGEHLYVIIPPAEVASLLVGHRGATAQAFRNLARAWANRRGWGARIDVRVKRL